MRNTAQVMGIVVYAGEALSITCFSTPLMSIRLFFLMRILVIYIHVKSV